MQRANSPQRPIRRATTCQSGASASSSPHRSSERRRPSQRPQDRGVRQPVDNRAGPKRVSDGVRSAAEARRDHEGLHDIPSGRREIEEGVDVTAMPCRLGNVGAILGPVAVLFGTPLDLDTERGPPSTIVGVLAAVPGLTGGEVVEPPGDGAGGPPGSGSLGNPHMFELE